MVQPPNDRGALPEEVDVVVIGGGPAGLTAAALLGEQGVNVVLFETRVGPPTHLKGPYVHSATAEIYQRWGVLDAVEDETFPFEKSAGLAFAVTLADGEVSAMRRAEDDADLRDHWLKLSPETPRFVPALAYERELAKVAAGLADVRFGFHVDRVEQGEPFTVVHYASIDESGPRGAIRARYVLGADGEHSVVRPQVGIEQAHGLEDDVPAAAAVFAGDIEKYLREPIWWIIFTWAQGAGATEGLGAFGYFARTTIEDGTWVYNYTPSPGEEFDDETLRERIIAAVGDPEFQPTILQKAQYTIPVRLAKNWRSGNVFLLGDAAHKHSPWGGFGQNLAVQEAFNLAWKLSAVLRGEAADALLDTYEQERKPFANKVLKATSLNDRYFEGLRTQYHDFDSEDPDGRIGRELIELFGPLLADGQFSHEGIQLGHRYVSDAVIDDGSVHPASLVGEYRPATTPGARAPHVWLRDRNGQRVSTRSLFGAGFVLLENSASGHWARASEGLTDPGITAYTVGRGGDFDDPTDGWARTYALSAGGAVLVRPDGYIAARFVFSGSEDEAARTVRAALRTVLQQKDSAVVDVSGAKAAR